MQPGQCSHLADCQIASSFSIPLSSSETQSPLALRGNEVRGKYSRKRLQVLNYDTVLWKQQIERESVISPRQEGPCSTAPWGLCTCYPVSSRIWTKRCSLMMESSYTLAAAIPELSVPMWSAEVPWKLVIWSNSSRTAQGTSLTNATPVCLLTKVSIPLLWNYPHVKKFSKISKKRLSRIFLQCLFC